VNLLKLYSITLVVLCLLSASTAQAQQPFRLTAAVLLAFAAPQADQPATTGSPKQDDTTTQKIPSSSTQHSSTGSGTSLAGDGANGADDSASSDKQAGASVELFRTFMLLGVILVTLAVASIVGVFLRRQPPELINPALIARFSQRVNTWWLMAAVLTFSITLHAIGTIVLFALVSFWALREFITMAPTRRGDHRALFWALIVFTPLQYVLIGLEQLGWLKSIDHYGVYSIMIPVYASIFVPARIALSGDHKRFLERSAQITSGLLICVYALSHAPALINLKLVSSDGSAWQGSPIGLFFFFVLLSQLSELLQWTWGQVFGRRLIAEEISTSRTWEGFYLGTLSLGLIGAALWWVTPFTIWEAACISMIVGVMGMFGSMTMSAIKRDRGVTDYGSLVVGHAGVLDRIDTLCFSAPVFYHLTRFFFTQ
jgi:phosphatidate cytidylyltransferase